VDFEVLDELAKHLFPDWRLHSLPSDFAALDFTKSPTEAERLQSGDLLGAEFSGGK
jgi:hypothetical protein